MKILGISAYFHDSAVALIDSGEIVAAANEERFTRVKQTPDFPQRSLDFCLDYAGLGIDEIDYVAFYDKPIRKFERLLETYYGKAPRGLASFIKAMPPFVTNKLLLERTIKHELFQKRSYQSKKPEIIFSDHHLSHGASAFYPSPFHEAAILVMDAVGEWATTTISHGNNGAITLKKQLDFPHSYGMLYSAFTAYLGFAVNRGEYKMMGLSPYGQAQGDAVAAMVAKIKENLVVIYPDGSLWLDMSYFDYLIGDSMTNDKNWLALFGFPRRLPGQPINNNHVILALAIQRVLEEGVLAIARHCKELTASDHLVLAGGVALNCVANGKLRQAEIFDSIWVQPAAGDAGGALGAALAAWHIFLGEKSVVTGKDRMAGSYLGPWYGGAEVEKVARRYRASYTHFRSEEKLLAHVAKKISEGAVVGFFHGRMEWGPRSLGNRSILADPRDPGMQRRLNEKVKSRESFRPFAPAMLFDEAKKYFGLRQPSPYMFETAELLPEFRLAEETCASADLKERLASVRSPFPAVTHVDYSSRIQTVAFEMNPRFYRLLCAFKEVSGLGMLVNTSFNGDDEPIVCTPDNAYQAFRRLGLDLLVMGNYVFIG